MNTSFGDPSASISVHFFHTTICSTKMKIALFHIIFTFYETSVYEEWGPILYVTLIVF